jgi:LmbE family N-acetylglucosaminyl deacetylase
MKKLLKRMAVAGWRAVVPKEARNSLRLWLMLEMPDRAPRLINRFDDPSVVVLAPHMDDEIIGPGGSVALHVRAESLVTFVFMTDGAAGDPEILFSKLPNDELKRRKRELSQTRKMESQQAAKLLGVTDLRFLDGPDGALRARPAMVHALCEILEQRRPGLIYAPALTDNHRDHWATNRILRAALDRLPTRDTSTLLIRGYEVWTALPANCMADISSVGDLKRQAIDVFASQTRFVDYSRAIVGLNQYRSMMHLLGKGMAEAFLQSTCDEYCELFDRIELKRAKR